MTGHRVAIYYAWDRSQEIAASMGSDATLWSSTAGGLDSLRRFWRNVVTWGIG